MTYWIDLPEDSSLLARWLFVMLVMERYGLDYKKIMKPPKELIEWVQEYIK